MTEVAKSRRTIARAALALLCGFGAWQVFAGAAHAQAHKPVLHVFLQLDVKASALEKTLQEHLPDLAVTVFGRFQDFESSLREAHPDAVLCITPVLEYQGTQLSLQGLRGGKNTEPYILVSSGEPLASSLDGKTIGVVDLMGRDGTQSFLSRLLGQGVKAKRVAKMEDLLPLLQFAAADGVVMPTAALARLKERTQLPLKARDIPNGQVGLPAVAILNSGARNLIANAFHKLDAGSNGLLGVDAWSAP